MLTEQEISEAAVLSCHSYAPHEPVPLSNIRKVATFVVDGLTVMATLYVDDERRVAYFATDGTGSFSSHDGRADMRRNVRIWQRRMSLSEALAHRGYAAVAGEIVASAADLLLEGVQRGYSIIYTGHSAGGAIALLLALELRGHCVTFGQPRVVSPRTIRDTFDQNREYVRVQNGSDLVPRLPWPIPFLYGHGGELLYLPVDPEKRAQWNPSPCAMLKDRFFSPPTHRLGHHSMQDYLDGLREQYVNIKTD